MRYLANHKHVLLIQPPAGTFDALVNSGLFLPTHISNVFQGQIEKILQQIKLKQYRLVITGVALGGELESGLELIDKLLQNNRLFKETQIIIYTYHDLLGDLQKFVDKKWSSLPDNWQVIPKQTTYYFEHDDLIKHLKNK